MDIRDVFINRVTVVLFSLSAAYAIYSIKLFLLHYLSLLSSIDDSSSLYSFPSWILSFTHLSTQTALPHLTSLLCPKIFQLRKVLSASLIFPKMYLWPCLLAKLKSSPSIAPSTSNTWLFPDAAMPAWFLSPHASSVPSFYLSIDGFKTVTSLNFPKTISEILTCLLQSTVRNNTVTHCLITLQSFKCLSHVECLLRYSKCKSWHDRTSYETIIVLIAFRNVIRC